jgi:protein ImuB
MMNRSYVSIWFPFLTTDWLSKKNAGLKELAFVTASKQRGRMIVTAANNYAVKNGIYPGMTLADARAISPGLEMIEDEEGIENKLLHAIATWCIRFTPITAVDGKDGIMLESTGCYHLWGNELNYLREIKKRFTGLGYQVKLSMAPTIAAAWAMARFAKDGSILSADTLVTNIEALPAAALRLESTIIEKLNVSGLYRIGLFARLPAPTLRRRFGEVLIHRLDQIFGRADEWLQPISPVEEYTERLPCLEPVFTATAIEIAIARMIEGLCKRLKEENKGLRNATLKCYRVDHKIIEINIGTSSPSSNENHLNKLFQLKIDSIAPGFGIELFTLTAGKVQELKIGQHVLWNISHAKIDQHFFELVDRIKLKIPGIQIHRFQPQEHYWPERTFKESPEINKPIEAAWTYTRPRPTQLLAAPAMVIVTAPVPDYPPMSFRYKGKLHKIVKADGPERIEPEWWISEGQHRDYYYVEDEEGKRYWLFRSGHYNADKNYQWFLHGFFA